MPRILTPNNSFNQRRGSQSYRPSAHRSFTSRRNSDDGNSITQIIDKWSFNSWGQPSSNTPPVAVPNKERGQSPPSPNWRPPYSNNSHPRSSTTNNRTSNRSNQTQPNSRFRVVARRTTEAPNTCRSSSSFIPSSHQVHEDAWGQFVDTTEEDEKIISHSRILSR